MITEVTPGIDDNNDNMVNKSEFDDMLLELQNASEGYAKILNSFIKELQNNNKLVHSLGKMYQVVEESKYNGYNEEQISFILFSKSFLEDLMRNNHNQHHLVNTEKTEKEEQKYIDLLKNEHFSNVYTIEMLGQLIATIEYTELIKLLTTLKKFSNIISVSPQPGKNKVSIDIKDIIFLYTQIPTDSGKVDMLNDQIDLLVNKGIFGLERLTYDELLLFTKYSPTKIDKYITTLQEKGNTSQNIKDYFLKGLNNIETMADYYLVLIKKSFQIKFRADKSYQPDLGWIELRYTTASGFDEYLTVLVDEKYRKKDKSGFYKKLPIELLKVLD